MESRLSTGASDLLGVSQASSVAMETGFLWPQRLPQDLSPFTQTLALLPLGHSQKEGGPRRARSERRRERELMKPAAQDGQSKELKEGKGP